MSEFSPIINTVGIPEGFGPVIIGKWVKPRRLNPVKGVIIRVFADKTMADVCDSSGPENCLKCPEDCPIGNKIKKSVLPH